VKILLENNPEVNANDEHYSNALEAASSRGHMQVVKLLLKINANVNAQGG
jgi:ankyrin repeat protein